MPNLAQHAALAVDDGLARRIRAAIVQHAVTVTDAPKPADGDPGEDEDRPRRGLALRVLDDPTVLVARFAWVMGANATIIAAYVAGGEQGVPDTDIEFVVGQEWDRLATVAG